MVAKNDITGDKIQTKPTTKEYEDGWDRIFGGCKKTSEGDLEVQVTGKCPAKGDSCFCIGECHKEKVMSGNSDQAYEDYADAARQQPIKEKEKK